MGRGYFKYNWHQKCSRGHKTENNSTSALILFLCMCLLNTRRSPMGSCLTVNLDCIFLFHVHAYVLVFVFFSFFLEFMCIVQCTVCFPLPTLTCRVAWQQRIFRIFNFTKTERLHNSIFFLCTLMKVGKLHVPSYIYIYILLF